MVKNKINYNLVNTSLLILIIYLMYQTKDFWFGIFDLFWKITMPFFIAFALAYAVYPLVKKLIDKSVPKSVAIFLVVFIISAITIFIVSLITPLLIDQTINLFNGIVSFLKEISLEYNINFKDVQNTLSISFNNIIEKLGTYISNGAISVISISVDYMSKLFIIFTSFVYFLIDMDRIRKIIKNYLKNKSNKLYNYVSLLDDEMIKYLSGFIKIVLISFAEYSLVYTLIGHPDGMLLGSLAALGNIIPYFGGIITNIIAAITAFVISPELFIKTCIVFVIFSGIDGNIINPIVYGKSNQIHPLAVIISVFAGGILFGTIGVIISLPMSIIIISTFKYFKYDLIKIKEKHIKIEK